LCYAVAAGYRGDKTYGGVSAYVGTTPERAQESLDVLRGELERITTPAGKVTPEEFNRAKIGLKSSLVFSGESTAARAGTLGADVRRLGKPRSLEEAAAEVEGVTLEQLNAYLSKRELGKMTIQTLGPAALKA
jgi:predicted Zn-dependent peptidase